MEEFPPEVVAVIEAFDRDAALRRHTMRWGRLPEYYRGLCARCGGVARLYEDRFDFGATGDPRAIRCDGLLELD